MIYTTIEIKAKSSKEQQEEIRKILIENNADLFGVDNQTDTYFKVKEKGRMLKIRKGDIEDFLVDYNKQDKENPKKSEFLLQPLLKGSYDLKKITRQTYEILAEVRKKREIYFIDNINFHIDLVENLGRFVEIEAISEKGAIQTEKLQEQCEYYKKLLEIKDEDLIGGSYIDMLIEKMELIKTNRK